MIDNCPLPIGLALGGVSSESRIIADLSDCADFSIVLGFTRCPCSNSRCVVCRLFLSDANVSSRPFNPTYDEHLP